MPEKYNITSDSVMDEMTSGETPLVNRKDNISIWMSEPGLYKLIFRSKVTRAEMKLMMTRTTYGSERWAQSLSQPLIYIVLSTGEHK